MDKAVTVLTTGEIKEGFMLEKLFEQWLTRYPLDGIIGSSHFKKRE